MLNASTSLLAMQAQSRNLISGKAKVDAPDNIPPFSQLEKPKITIPKSDDNCCDECVKQTACILCCVPRTLHFLYGVCTAKP